MWIYHRCLTMQEVNGLRNRYLDTYLPPRRKQSRAQNEPAREQITLQFLHYPITDLSIPTSEQCVPPASILSWHLCLLAIFLRGFRRTFLKALIVLGTSICTEICPLQILSKFAQACTRLSLPSPHAAAVEISSMEALTKESLDCGRVQSITEDIRRRLEAGEKIYMHCWGGRGRAGTLGACLLGDLYGIGAEDALLRVQKAFDTRGDAGLPLSELE